MRRTCLVAVFFALIALSGGLAFAAPTPVDPAEAQAWARYLVPLPKSLNISHKVDVDPATIAIIPPGGSDVVVEQACKELRHTLGLAEDAPNPSSPGFTITLVLGGAEADPLISLKNSEQASKITIEPGSSGLRLIALQPRGLYYAVKSLQQLIAPYVSASNARMPLFTMTDWPDMMDRGLWGCDHFLWLRWMADRKMNIGEQISAREVHSDLKGYSFLKQYRETMVTEGPYYGLAPVPVTLHLEQVSGLVNHVPTETSLFKWYPQVWGVGGQEGCICYSQGDFTHVLADWIVDLASLPFVEGVDVWMAENLHGKEGCQCAQCSVWDRNVLEANTIVAAWNQAKARLGRYFNLWILTSEETYSSNTAVFAALPSDVRVWYYHSLYTYTSGRLSIIPNNLSNLANSGRYAGVCPSLSAIGCTQPFQSAEFINYRMNDFVDKKMSGLIGYATPPPLVSFVGYNVEAAAEWSWNVTGRTIHEFAASYAVRKGYFDPERFAQWADAVGKVEFDIYGSDWPASENKFWPGAVSKDLRDGTLPALGEAYAGARGPWGEFKSAQQLDNDVALAAKALSLAKQMGISEYWYESLYIDGNVSALRALYKLDGLVVGGAVSPANKAAARYYFGVYVNSLQQSIDAVQNWCMVVNNESTSVGTVVGILHNCIYGDGTSDNPGMLQVAADLDCTPTLVYTAEPAVTIADAKRVGAGALVKLYGDLVSGGYGNSCFIQERDHSAGIRVRTSSAVTTSAPAMVLGYVENADGELVINTELMQAAGAVEPVTPLRASMRSLAGGAFGGQPAVMEYRLVRENGVWVRRLLPTEGLNNLGLYLRVTGRVTFVGTDYFYVDDGGMCDDDSGNYGVRVLCADPAWEKPALGDYVIVDAMSSAYFERGLTWRALYLSSPDNVTSVPGPLQLILDEHVATFTGDWTYSTVSGGAYVNDYKSAATAAEQNAAARWTPKFPWAGNYDAYVMYCEGSDRTAKAPYTISYDGGSQTYEVDQTTGGGAWHLLGTKTFAAGTAGYVQLGNATTDTGKSVIADAVKFVYAGEGGNTPPSITGQPSDQLVCLGATATFTVTASGSGALSYQWRRGTVNITDDGHCTGAATDTLTIYNCDPVDAAPDYKCVVSSKFGSATSINAALTVATVPDAPTAQAASDIGTDTITWNWGSVTGATGYKLWTAPSGGTQIGGTLTTTSYTETGMDPGTLHTRYVEAVGMCGVSATRTQLGPMSTTARYCVENGDFEGGFTSGVGNHWIKESATGTFAQETTIKYDGTSSQKLVDPVGQPAFTAYLYQKLNVQPSRGYALRVNHRREVTTGAVCQFGVDCNGGGTPNPRTDSNGTAGVWKLKSLIFTSGATGLITIMFHGGANGGDTTVYVDGVYVVAQAPAITSGSTTISAGGSATITASGGFGGTDSELHWYTGAAGTGAHVGTGTSLVVSPTVTTIYYPRWEPTLGGACWVSDDGAVVTVTVNSAPMRVADTDPSR